MAVFTVSMALSAGGTLTGSDSLTDANAQRIIAVWRPKLGLPENATAQQVLAALEKYLFNHVKTITMNDERAKQQEAITVADIT